MVFSALEFESNYCKKLAMHDLLAHSGCHPVSNLKNYYKDRI